ncbi:hypothetical protein [Arthrobacter sp. ZGTC131]|uniref:hypothetical protein n=1 Tax=Arthrobacter sp. ZGTC131 TaxID=2058898 RepID=UPI0011B00738|nr:hypothetical protein [Arthrobacter sp. ZGTC131]
MPNSALSSTAMMRVDGFRDEQPDVPDAGLDDASTSDLGPAPGTGAEILPAGQTESLIPKIFPVYAFI